jgi:fluoride exporter
VRVARPNDTGVTLEPVCPQLRLDAPVVEAEGWLSGRLVGVRGSWDRRRAVAIAVGGVVGAVLRWAVTSVDAGRFPWPVLAVNVAGSFILGVLLAEEWSHPRARLVLHDAGGIGFCGSLTTFSTFSVEVVNLSKNGDVGIAAVYTVASIAATVAAVVAGAAVLRRLRALTLPLEEQP